LVAEHICDVGGRELTVNHPVGSIGINQMEMPGIKRPLARISLVIAYSATRLRSQLSERPDSRS